MLHLLHSYWGWTGGNIAAMPLEALAAALAGLLFRKPLRRLASWAKRRVLADVHGRLNGIEEAAHAARRIAADTHKHVTGKDHPSAPAAKPDLVDPAEFLAQFDDPSLRAPIYGRKPPRKGR